MLHILVTILKIVGILLLVILGILVFVLFSVLFVPFRYSVEGEKYKEEQQDGESQVIKAKVVVSWLAHLVHFRFRIHNKGCGEVSSTNSNQTSDKESKIKTDMELYLFGIPVFAWKNKIATNSKKSKVKTNTVESEDNLDVADVSEAKEQSKDSIEADVTERTVPTEDMVSVDNKETFADSTMGTENLGDDSLEIDDTVEEATEEVEATEKVNPIKKVIQTIQGIPGKIKAKVEQIKLTIKKICDKIRAGSGFLKDETTEATIRLLLGKLKNILIHILPKKLKGNLMFGFDDPALTGEVLGVASLFYPKYQKTLKLIPVFEKQILEGKVKIKGRIVIAYIIWQVIKILLDKNARLTFTNAKKLVAEIKK